MARRGTPRTDGKDCRGKEGGCCATCCRIMPRPLRGYLNHVISPFLLLRAFCRGLSRHVRNGEVVDLNIVYCSTARAAEQQLSGRQV